jgi:hypothetical protein
MPKMICTAPHKFQGVDRKVGDIYEALGNDADMLRKVGWAANHVEPAAKAEDEKPKRAPKKRDTAEE